MKEAHLSYRKLVLVCTNERVDRESCAQKDSAELLQHLKYEVAMRDRTIRVSRAGCLGNCLEGASVVIMPDNIWLAEVTIADVPEILNRLQLT